MTALVLYPFPQRHARKAHRHTSHPARPDTACPAAFAAGRMVHVRSALEILATLDADGTLDGLPFMPEMVAHIGKSLRIRARASRACVEGEGLRGMADTVFLEEARCDGAAHDDCQRGCDTFWKTAWLTIEPEIPQPYDLAEQTARETLLALATRRDESYHCQSTALKTASLPLGRIHAVRLLDELRQGDLSLMSLSGVVARAGINRLRRLFGLPEMGRIVGKAGPKTRGALNLKSGDWVRVRDIPAIRATLGPDSSNLGLSFEPEMTRAVGQVFQVDRVISRIIHEVDGQMVTLSNTVTLRGLHCAGHCTKACPRANPLFWREAWLERTRPKR